jgi:hypothetical protein
MILKCVQKASYTLLPVAGTEVIGGLYTIFNRQKLKYSVIIYYKIIFNYRALDKKELTTIGRDSYSKD